MPRNTVRLKYLDMSVATGSNKTGHTIYKKCFDQREKQRIPTIVKLNKEVGPNGGEHSLLEVVAGDVTRFYMGTKFTPKQDIILTNDSDEIIGVTSQNFSYHLQCEIQKGERTLFAVKDLNKSDGHRIYSPNQWTNQIDEKNADLGYAFLDEQPQNQFDTLLSLHKKGSIELDMDSLACVFGASYVFEEDDLHKGNIGYYVTRSNPPKKGEKPRVHFFKIDHDLMFAESIMSRRGAMRVASLVYNHTSFQITARDITEFPDLRDSGNHYWPTKKRTVVKGDKAYHRAEERNAFASLKKSPAFIAAKWKYFLKFAVVHTDSIDAVLGHHLDLEKDVESYTMIQTALSERLSEFRRVLLTTPDFRTFLQKENKDGAVMQHIKDEVVNSYLDLNPNLTSENISQIKAELETTFTLLKTICARPVGELAIYNAILLGDYEFNDASYSTKSIEDGLALAKTRFDNSILAKADTKAFKYACIMVHLVGMIPATELTQETEAMRNLAMEFKHQFLTKPETIKTFEAFKYAVAKIRQSNLPLAQQKNEVVNLLKAAYQLTDPNELKKLSDALSFRKLDPDLKFIRQLRSSWWIVRMIRSAYGYTSTSGQLLAIIRARGKENSVLAGAAYVSQDVAYIMKNTMVSFKDSIKHRLFGSRVSKQIDEASAVELKPSSPGAKGSDK